MLIYQTTNLVNALGKLAELKLEVCTKKIIEIYKEADIAKIRGR